MLWLVLAFMSLVAIGFAVRPLVRDLRRQRMTALMAIFFVAVASAALYSYTGSPDVPSGPGQQPDVGAMVAALAARLESEPDNLNGWKMLGRSYLTLGDFKGAVTAFERAVQLESAENPQTLVDLGLALLQAAGQQPTPRAVTLFENALALEPNHPEALFYSGFAAANRGDESLAADRWEALLATNPPAEIRSLLEQRIAAWRGQPVAAAARPELQSDAVVEVAVSLSDSATSALPAEATVFVIARDPAAPSPPIAVTRRRLSELPAVVSLGDRESMMPGRSLSGFDEFELVARVSVSGTPVAQPGDWFGTLIVRPSGDPRVALSIDERVQ